MSGHFGQQVVAAGRVVRLAYCLSHPIQYQEPLLRRLAAEPGLDLTVYYGSDFSARQYKDRGFDREVTWDIPLLQGYKYKVLPRLPGTRNIYSARPPSFGYLRQFLGGRYDVVWSHGYHTANALHALVAARLTRAKTMVRTDSTLHDRDRSPARQRVRRAFFSGLQHLVDAVLPVGQRNAEYWHAMLPATPQFPLPYAVDNDWFAQRAQSASRSRQELRAELGLVPGRPVILFAAKLIARKRCNDMIDSYHRLLQTWPDTQPKPHLLIVGDGEQAAQLSQQAANVTKSEQNAIIFAGFRSQAQIARFYDLCDVFCLPSVHEPWGLAVNEAMACSRPVIVSDQVGCQPDLVHHERTGLVFPAKDTQALAACLRRVLADAAFASQIAAAGCQHVASFTFEADVAGLWRAIEALGIEGRKAI